MKKRVSKSAGKIDKIVTWVIIWTAVASMIWLSKTKKWQEVTRWIKQRSNGFFAKIKKFFGKTTIFIIKIFNRKN